MRTAEERVRWHKATIAAGAATVLACSYALAESWLHAMPRGVAEGFTALLFGMRAAVIFALLPTLFLTYLLSRIPSSRLERLPWGIAVVAVALCIALKPANWWIAPVMFALALAGRSVSWVRKPDAESLRVSVTSALVAFAFALTARFHWGSPDSDAFVHGIVSDSLLVVAPVSLFGSAAVRVVRQQHGRLLFAIATLLAVIGAGVLADLYFSLYVVPKLFVLFAGSCAIAVYCSGAMIRAEAVRARTTASVVAAVWVAVVGFTAFQDVPERFGRFPLESMVGFTSAAVSLIDDRDLDGYYDVAAGGNDCAPHKRSTTREIAACLAGSAPTDSPEHELTFSRPVRHVFVIVVDALRPDAVGVGPTKVEAPANLPGFSRLMSRGVTFKRAYGAGSSTYIVFRPMLSGVDPLRFLERDARLAEAPAHQALAAKSGLFSFQLPGRRSVFFQTPLFPDRRAYIGQEPETRAITGLTTDSVVDAATAWLNGWHTDGAEGSIVMTLYTHDPHAAYECADGSRGGRRCYDDEVANVDRGLARFQSLLDRYDLWEDSVVVVLSDHGEAFGEHHQYFHASSLYEEQIRVPLIIAHPGLPAGEVRDEPVSVMRLVATLADATHSSAEQRSNYASLLPVAHGDGEPRGARVPIAHDFLDYSRPYPSRRSALIMGDEKLIYDWGSRATLLFDLAEDPAELVNLAERRAERARELEKELARQILRSGAP